MASEQISQVITGRPLLPLPQLVATYKNVRIPLPTALPYFLQPIPTFLSLCCSVDLGGGS